MTDQGVTKGFTLGVLRESLLKCKQDSGSTRGRIRRMATEVTEVDKRIHEQSNSNVNLKAELGSMKKRRDDLNDDILKTNKYLDNLTKANCDFIKEKVVVPAEHGINVAKESIDCFREIIDSSYKLNMLFRREHPEKGEASTQINRPFPSRPPVNETERQLLKEVVKLERELYKKQEQMRDAKSIARGNKSNRGNFVSFNRADLDEKRHMLQRLKEEEEELERELDLLEHPDKAQGDQLNPDASLAVPMEEGGDGPAVASVLSQDPAWMPPPPQAVPVGSDDDMAAQQGLGFEEFDM